MEQRIDELLGTNTTADPLRYMIYSAHDDQLSNIMEWLHPTNVAQNYVLYAAQTVFELRYDSECVSSAQAGENCFSVHVIWNCVDLAFKECTALVEGGCTYAEFLTHMHNIWYDGVDSDDLN